MSEKAGGCGDGKVFGLDRMTVEAWKCLGEKAVGFLTKLRPVFRDKDDVQSCSGDYSGIKLISLGLGDLA